MNRSLSLSSSLVLTAFLFAIPSYSADIGLSGTVTDLSGKALSGAGVVLVRAGNATTTSASGAWSISATSTGIVVQPKSSAASVTRHLVLDGNRLRLHFDGMDAVGRPSSGTGGIGDGSSKTAGTVVAVRSLAVYVDTLLYSWKGHVRARVGITSLTAGAIGSQAIDTSTIPWNSSVSYDSLSYGGQTYKTVKIGTQTWMAENLNLKVDSSWCYANSADSCAKYGSLYQWAAAMGLDTSYNNKPWSGTLPWKGICLTGWHVPSDPEWTTLANYLGGATTAGKKLKSTNGWLYSGNGTDVYGFRALPAGFRFYDGSILAVVGEAYFWSSSENDTLGAWARFLDESDAKLLRIGGDNRGGYSVRCLKDVP